MYCAEQQWGKSKQPLAIGQRKAAVRRHTSAKRSSIWYNVQQHCTPEATPKAKDKEVVLKIIVFIISDFRQDTSKGQEPSTKPSDVCREPCPGDVAELVNQKAH